MKNLFLLFVSFLFFQLTTFSQAPDTMWTKTFGLISSDVGTSVIETTNGNFVVTGLANTTDLGLLKTDANGNLLWLKTFGGAYIDVGYSVIQTQDGGYIIAGATESFGAGDFDAWLIKVDSNGNQQWSHTYGGSDSDLGLSVKQTADGGYIIAGYTKSYGAGMYDVWLIRVDPNGNPGWAKTFGATGDDYGYSVELTSDDGFVVVGYQNSFTAGGYDIGFLKADQNGNLVWLKYFGGPQDDKGYSVKKTADGGFAITGSTESFGVGGSDVWLIKTDSNGNEQWSKTYGGVQNDVGRSLEETSDGSFVITGITNSLGAGADDVGFLKTDPSGNLQWMTTFGGTQDDNGYSIQQTADGGYIIVGGTYSYGAGLQDVWLIKTEPDASPVEEQIIITDYNLYQNYPNPFNPSTKIKYSVPQTSQVQIEVFDVLGKEIETLLNKEKPAGTYELTWNAGTLPSGVYFYQLRSGSFVDTKKMILLK